MQKKLINLGRLILSDRNTRNLFFFLVLNLLFAFVELTYGLWTNSLGLISDSFHMFFDCSALLLGLAASIITKWKPSEKFTYGFGRAEILAGLVNGFFLLFVALFIMKEAVERTFEPPEVHHERLFVISVLGFLVNLVGIFVFQHGGQGHHHHGGCSHSTHHNHTPNHDKARGQQDGVVALDMNGFPSSHNHQLSQTSTNNSFYEDNTNHQHHHNRNRDLKDHHHDHAHNHSLSHYHSHAHDQVSLVGISNVQSKTGGRGQIMQSVFLHIVADTLGSVGVMISAVLMNQFGWMIADPLCSLFIAILISISVYPLLRDSIFVLMQRVPVEVDDKLPSCLQRIQGLKGVLSVHEAHIWSLTTDTYVGCLKLEVSHDANHKYIMSSTKTLLNHIGVDKVHIQIDYV